MGRLQLDHPRVLVVSDDPGNVFLLENLCRANGYPDMDITGSGIEAMKRLGEGPYGLAIVDTSVKDLPGWTLIREMKAADKIANLPTMLVGSNVPPATPTELEAYGIVQFCKLPTTPSNFLFVVSSTLELFRAAGTRENKYTHAKAALIAESTDKAIALYAELRSASNDTRSSVGLAQSYIQKNDVVNAQAVVAGLPVEDDGFAAGLQLDMALKRKDMPMAHEAVAILVGLTPSSPFYYMRCMRAAERAENVEILEHVCNLAVAKNIMAPDFQMALGKIYFGRKEYPRSLAAADALLDRYGAAVEPLNLRGASLRKLARPEEAIRCYEEALKVAPLDHKIHFNLAICANSMGQFDLAQTYLASCLRISPGFKRAEELSAEIAERMGMWSA